MLFLDVDFYNYDHKALLSNSHYYKGISKLVQNSLSVTEDEFLIYTVFREQKDLPGWRTYKELKARLPPRRAMFNEYFDITKGTIRARFNSSQHNDITQTEAAGVGAALSLVSAVFGFTEADWEKIPVKPYKDLDFQIASTGSEIIEVEAKGSIVDDNTVSSSISKAKRDIEEKKEVQRIEHNNRNSLLGVITSFPSFANQNAKCRILDPPAAIEIEDPYKYKLLSHLHFYAKELAIISKTHLLIALANRIKDIELIDDYRKLDGNPLLNMHGDKLITPVSLFESKTVIEDKLSFGEVFPVNGNQFIYYGLDSKIIDILINQDFNEIVTFKSSIEREFDHDNLAIDAIVRKSELLKFQIDFSEYKKSSDARKVYLPMIGRSFSSTAGRTIGEFYMIT